MISIEDKRFYTNSGIDLRGIARALWEDVRHRASVQGASTIEQQFIKNALQAQSHRTILEKLREAALAYQLSHKWTKEKIITAYLNTIYFGNGAYGIEAAAQTYFGQEVNHQGCGTPGQPLCVEQLKPWEAALLAGIIQSPSGDDPALHPIAARERRNLVLREMLEQGYITKPIYEMSVGQALPSPKEIQPPHEPTVNGVDAGYFTSWVEQQIIERYGQRAFYGGLRIKTTLDLELQRAAEQAIDSYLPGPEGPSSAMVVIENSTGEVRAMVGGRNYDETPFNLATEGERQPGSSFKAFDLAAALEEGISPYSEWPSREKTFYVHGPGGLEKFVVHNDEGAYSGTNTLTGATAFSDNSIYAEVGLKVGTTRIAALAHRMGITTPLSTNAAMTIGGLTVGVTPIDMAHAYETIAHGGRLVTGTMAEDNQPVGIQEVSAHEGGPLRNGSRVERNRVLTHPVIPSSVAETETSMLEAVVQYGTGKAAALGQFAAGKTGTTSNYGDAWFVGWDSKFTVAVWVGFPNKLVPMTNDFEDGPVLGGTYPALIWHAFQVAAIQLEKARAESSSNHSSNSTSGEGSSGSSSASEASGGTPATTVPAGQGAKQAPSTKTPAQTGGGQSPGTQTAAPPATEHQPAQPTPAAPAPSTPPAPSEPAPTGAESSKTGGVSPTG